MTRTPTYEEFYARGEEVRGENEILQFLDSVRADPGIVFEPQYLALMAETKQLDLAEYHRIRGILARDRIVDVRAWDEAVAKAANGAVPPNVEPFPVDTIFTLLESPPRCTLVKGFAGRGELILFYGPPKHGKTFLASHFAISVAVRADWFGRKCKAPEGFALYCALEGGSGMRQRLKAILQHDPALGKRITAKNLFIMRQRVDLRQPADVARLQATIAKHERETGLPCLLVVIDTVARALGSGHDTDPGDMAALISAADIIRQTEPFKPTVALIHHAGKDVGRGPRGRSDLPGAIDACVLVERLENGHGNRATCELAKDDDDGWAIDFRLEQVEIGHRRRRRPDHHLRPARRRSPPLRASQAQGDRRQALPRRTPAHLRAPSQEARRQAPRRRGAFAAALALPAGIQRRAHARRPGTPQPQAGCRHLPPGAHATARPRAAVVPRERRSHPPNRGAVEMTRPALR
jgi:AAA domain